MEVMEIFLKILIVHELFPPEVAGGGEKLVLRLAKSLIERGHSIKVITSGNPKIRQYDGIQTIRLPINRYMMNLAVPTIVKHARNSDIIQTSSGNTGFPSWAASKITKKPVCLMVCHIFGRYWKDVQGPLKGRLFEFMEKMFLARSYDATVFLNSSSKRIGKEIGIDVKNTYVLNPGIDFNKFQIGGIKKEPFVMTVGNFSMNKPTVKIKGIEYVLEAARELPDIKFVVVGTGEYMAKLEKNASKNIQFFSNLSDNELIKLYNKALVYCAPSLAEGFGFTILEAMGSGSAVISSIDLGQRGKVIRPKNTEDIVKEVRKLIDNPTMAKSIGKQNKKVAKKFLWEKFVDGIEKIYEPLVVQR